MNHGSAIVAGVFLLAALYSLVELFWSRARAEVESYIADREAQATHLLMNAGMAAMVMPFYDAAIGRWLLVAFAVGAAALVTRSSWFIVKRRGDRAAGASYHLIGMVAMIYAVRSMPVGMIMAPMVPHWPTVVLGTVFLLDALATFVLAGLFPRNLLRMERAVTDRRTSVTAIRASAFPHIVMDIGMAWMLLPIA